ncbi:hypothetical protein NQD34_018243 [Periophthalmus magnuspinnatus]|nr:hypothetical protein NQD34_018243 [Periophthalmus magnuspinnatus]
MSLRGHSGTPVPASPTERGQVSAITVVAILDKLAGMLESVQQNQQRMEQRQEELEGAVRAVQGDVTRLSKAHLNTANNVNKLLERSRKMNGGVKEVKERLDKQAVQVKRLENNHAHLLKRNHFKVLIFQVRTAVLLRVEEHSSTTLRVEEYSSTTLRVEEYSSTTLRVEEYSSTTLRVEEYSSTTLRVEEYSSTTLRVEEYCTILLLKYKYKVVVQDMT